MRKNLHLIILLAVGLVCPTNVFCQDEDDDLAVVIIPEGIPRDGQDGAFPFNGSVLSTDWSTAASQPTDWVAISVLDVLDLDNLPLTVEYPSKWKYDATLNATVLKSKDIAAHVLMLPHITIPEGADEVVLSFDAMSLGIPGVDGELGSVALAYCATEGKDVRFDGNTFFATMMGAVFDPEMNTSIISNGEFQPGQFVIKDKGGKGVNIVLVYIFLGLGGEPLAEDATYAFRNVKVYDPQAPISADAAAGNAISVCAEGRAILVQGAPEGAVVQVVNLQSGITVATQTVASNLETIAVPALGGYAVVVNGESFKVLVP